MRYTGAFLGTNCTKPAAGYTTSDVPIITKMSACDAASAAGSSHGHALAEENDKRTKQ